MNQRIAILLMGLALACGAAAADLETDHSRSIRIGGDENISEPVEGPLLAVGGNVTVSGPVTGKAQLLGGKVAVAPSAVISGDVGIAAGDVTIDGAIGGRLKAAAGKIRINGPVAGDASIAAGTLELGPAARIQGKLYFRGDELHQDSAAQVVGGVEREPLQKHWRERTPVERFLHGWVWTMGLMVLAAVIAAALPGTSSRMARELRESPGSTLISGFLAFTAVPVLGVLLMITIVGIPIALLALMAYGILLLAGYAWAAVILGGLLLDRIKPEVAAIAAWRVGAAVLATLAIALLARVPYLGGWVRFATLLAGVGMIAAIAFRRNPSTAA